MALIVVQFLFGALPAFSKIALAEVSAASLVLIRSFAATCLLGCAMLALYGKQRLLGLQSKTRCLASVSDMAEKHLSLRTWLKIFGLAFLGITLNQGILFLGLKKTTSAAAAILSPNIALATLCFSVAFKRERFAWRKMANVLMGFAGIFLLFLPQLKEVWARGDMADKNLLVGNVLCLISTSCYALFMVLSTNIVAEIGAITFSFRVFLCATLLNTFLFCVLEHSWPWELIGFIHPSTYSRHFWFALAYIVLGATFATYLLNAYALKKVSPSVVGGFVCLQPVVGVLVGGFLLKESIPASHFAGMALVVFGVLTLWWSNLANARNSLAHKSDYSA